MKKKCALSTLVFLFSCSILLPSLKAQQCDCSASNPCINGNLWFTASSGRFLTLDFLSQYSDSSYRTFQNYDVVAINSIPYVTYGGKKFSALDASQVKGMYSMDLYFPGAFTSPNNSGNKYPVLLFLPGGGFSSADRTGKFSDDCDSLAARGFIVAAISYRTYPLRPDCSDSENNYLLARAVQDAGLALRSLQAISQDTLVQNHNAYYYDNHKGTTKGLSLPFMDTKNIILGGTSAGSVVALTTAYYDACDINATLNYNNYLSGYDLCLDIHTTPLCDGVHVPFDLDERYNVNTLNLKDKEKVDFYFNEALYPTSPISNIVAVLNMKGGVPEPGINYCYRCFSSTSSTPDPTLPGVDPKYIANHSSFPSDYIPMIGFQGISDATIPYLSNDEYNYVIEGNPPANNKYLDFCLMNYNGFLWGSGKIYDKLTTQGITAQLYAEPGGSHDFEVDDKSFIFTQTALFVHSILCNLPITQELDSAISFSVPSSDIAFENSCNNSTASVTLQFKINNTNASAIITKVDASVKIVDVTAVPNVVLLDQKGVKKTVEYVGAAKNNYILPGAISDNFNYGPLALSQSIDANHTYQITLTISNPNGFGYTVFAAYKSKANVTNKHTPAPGMSNGCFAIKPAAIVTYNRIAITPNPSYRDFSLHFLPLHVIANIFDLTGRQIESLTGSDNDISFGENYQRGVYIVQEILPDGTTQFLKIIKM